MSTRQPKRITNETPHQKLNPREVKARSMSQSGSSRGPSAGQDAEDFLTFENTWEDQKGASFEDEYRRKSPTGRYQNYDGGYYDDYDYYDDPGYYGYHPRRSDNHRARRVIGKIFCYLQAAISIFFIIRLFMLNVLPTTTMIIITVIVVILWLIIFLSQRSFHNKGQVVGMIISILACLVLGLGSFYVTKTDEVIQTVTGQSYDIRAYDLVVRSDDAATDVKDTADYRYAIQASIGKDNMANVLGSIEEDIGKSVEAVEMSSAADLAQALLNKEVDAIVYNDAFNSTILEQFENYMYDARILGTYYLKEEAEVKSVEVDVTGSTFLVYISGNDTLGQVSLTGRSDVNIIAGINTVSKEVLLITIPRDMYVEFPGITAPGSRDKLTHSGIYGMEELIATVENMLNCSINYYVRLNFSSMIQIVDALGGVAINVEDTFTSMDGYEYSKGLMQMDGLYALNYVRERHAFEDGDFARGRHQVEMIQAMMDKLISVNTLTNYNQVADAVASFAATNLSHQDLTDIIKLQLSENPAWHVVTYQILGEVMMQPCQSANGASLSVDMPYKESLQNARTLLDQLYAGQVLSDNLQLVDDGTLTYVADPV